MSAPVLPGKILCEWIETWGSLTPELAERFLARPEVAELCLYPERVVFAAIHSEQRLIHAVERVQFWAGGNDYYDDSLYEADDDVDYG